MAFELKPWNRGISNDELLADLRAVAERLGTKTVKYEEYPSHGRASSRIFEARFGSWNDALKATGLVVSQRQNIPILEFFENMEKVWRTLGRQPRLEDMIKPLSAIGGSTYQKRFKGWRKALEAFVEYANSENPLPVENTTSRDPIDRRFPDLRLRWQVMSRHSFRCQSCGRSPAIEAGVLLHVDHRIPWSKGGRTRADNLQTLCDRCNLEKSDLCEESE